MKEIAGSNLENQPNDLTGQNETYIQRIGLPVFRQDPALDPDTLGNQSGRLTLEILADIASDEAGNDIAAERKNNNIRIVGPAFFPVQ